MADSRIADVSRWQGTIDWDEFRKHIDGVVIKASGSDGGLYTDGMLARNRDEARRVGLPRWFYHYKGNAGTPEEQARYMLNAIGGLQAGEGIVLDDENEGKVNTAFSAAFADEIKRLTGLNEVWYANLARFQGVDLSAVKQRDVGGWVAKYGQNTGTLEGAGAAPGGIDLPIIMWQYTSQARIPGVSANTVDMNVFYGDVEAFKKYGVKGSVPAPAPAPTPSPAPVAPGDGYYTVVQGDGLIKIGAKLGQDWRVIAATNGIVAPYTIFPGQRLKVFGGAPALPVAEAGYYEVVKGDGLIAIGVKTGHNWQDIANLNGIKAPYTIYPGQRLALPGGGVAPAAQTQATYTVTSRDYDGLAAAMARIGRSNWKAVADLNGLSAPYTIYPNQVLRLP